jgi:hypothetical protein
MAKFFSKTPCAICFSAYNNNQAARHGETKKEREMKTLDEMDSEATGMACKIGVGIVKATDDSGRKIECKTRWNRGKSGKMFTTIWYVDGKRTAKAKI